MSSDEGAKRLQIFGANKLEEKTESKFLKFLGFMWNPLSWVMEIAAIMAIVLANGGVKSLLSFNLINPLSPFMILVRWRRVFRSKINFE